MTRTVPHGCGTRGGFQPGPPPSEPRTPAAPEAREHFNYAFALIGESWIAEDGQQARSGGQIITNVRSALDLFAVVIGKEGNR